MAITVREATTVEDREKVYRLRYDIYVQEMGRKQTYADHAKRTVHEPYDDTAHLYIAEDDGEVVGTVRTNARSRGPLECEELYDLDQFAPFFPNRVSMTTKLMVKRSHRSTTATSQLMVHCYNDMRSRGVVLDFIDTNPHLVRLYQQVGYRIYKDNINHPDYGNVIPMVFLLDDIEYMEMIRSPFRRYARNFENTKETWSFFKEAFREYAYIRPVFAMDHDRLLELISVDTYKKPHEVLTFMRDFTESESMQLLNQLDLIDYRKKDYVFRQGDEGSGMFCILEGAVQVLVETDRGEVPIALINQGEIFGELGFVAHTKRNASIRARDESKILVLSPGEFVKLEKNHPHLAIKLLTNLFSILVERFNEKSRALMDLQSLFDVVVKRIEEDSTPRTEDSSGSARHLSDLEMTGSSTDDDGAAASFGRRATDPPVEVAKKKVAKKKVSKKKAPKKKAPKKKVSKKKVAKKKASKKKASKKKASKKKASKKKASKKKASKKKVSKKKASKKKASRKKASRRRR